MGGWTCVICIIKLQQSNHMAAALCAAGRHNKIWQTTRWQKRNNLATFSPPLSPPPTLWPFFSVGQLVCCCCCYCYDGGGGMYAHMYCIILFFLLLHSFADVESDGLGQQILWFIIIKLIITILCRPPHSIHRIPYEPQNVYLHTTVCSKLSKMANGRLSSID